MGVDNLKVSDSLRDRIANEINTAVPCKIVSFDSSNQTADIQLMIDKKNVDGEPTPIPTIEGVPIVQPNGGGFAITLPIKAGDMALAIFAQSNIDTFIEEGTQTVSYDNRSHDLQDAIVILGLNSNKANIPFYDSDGVSMRSLDGSTFVKVTSSTVEITASTLNITGDVTVTGDITAKGEVEGKGIQLSTHTHTISSGSSAGDTEPPS